MSWSPPKDHPISIEKAKELMAGDFGRSLMEVSASCIAPLYWWNRNSRNIENNGTAFFWDTGARLIAVTANHVLSGWEGASATSICQLGDMAFDPGARLIGRSKVLDVANFEMRPEELLKVGMGPKRPLSGPPAIPDVGRGILLAGYPGKERIQGGMECNFGIYSANGIATSVSDSKISWQVEHEFMVTQRDTPTPPANYDAGGISGGPMITLIERGGLLTWALGGVIFEASANYEIFFGSRADFINADGTISR